MKTELHLQRVSAVHSQTTVPKYAIFLGQLLFIYYFRVFIYHLSSSNCSLLLNLLLLDQREQVDTDKSSSAQSCSASEDTYPHSGNPELELVGSIFQSVSTVPAEIENQSFLTSLQSDIWERSLFCCAGMPLVSQTLFFLYFFVLQLFCQRQSSPNLLVHCYLPSLPSLLLCCAKG